MRIAILGDALDLQYAGIQVYLQGLLNALLAVDRNNEYLLVRPRAGGEFEGVKELIDPVIPFIPGHQRLRTFHSIPRRLCREGVDVVVEPAHFGPFGLPGHIKRITVIHDLTPVIFPEFHPFPSSLMHKLALPGILKKADCIIANSVHTKKDLETSYQVSKHKISIVSPGREGIFQPVQDPSILVKYGIRQPYLLCVGTIEPRKNLVTLLKAYEIFRSKTTHPVQLVLPGKKGWKNRSFFAALERSAYRKDVVLTGFTERSHLPALYSMAAIFVYPSWYEGFGLPVLEAMACGTPVLISHSSSLPEVGSNAAQYFDPNDDSALAGKLTALMDDQEKRMEMSRLSLNQAATFSWEKSARQFVSVINGLFA